MTDRPPDQIEPTDPKNHGKPIWVLYGHESMPSILCCILRATTADHRMLPAGERGVGVVIWGYSEYHGVPGFRTLGQDLTKWSEQSSYGPLFFGTQAPALDELRWLTMPSPETVLNKEYAVKASGHGSDYRFDGPPVPLRTLEEAIHEAQRWIGNADTIGGDAIVVHMPSGSTVWP